MNKTILAKTNDRTIIFSSIYVILTHFISSFYFVLAMKEPSLNEEVGLLIMIACILFVTSWDFTTNYVTLAALERDDLIENKKDYNELKSRVQKHFYAYKHSFHHELFAISSSVCTITLLASELVVAAIIVLSYFLYSTFSFYPRFRKLVCEDDQ